MTRIGTEVELSRALDMGKTLVSLTAVSDDQVHAARLAVCGSDAFGSHPERIEMLDALGIWDPRDIADLTEAARRRPARTQVRRHVALIRGMKIA